MPQSPENIVFFLFISIIAYALFSCTSAITIFRQIFVLKQGVTAKRTVYKKRAIQSLEFALVVNVFLFLTSAIDVMFAHSIFAHVGKELSFITVFFPAFLFANIVFLFLWIRVLKKSEETKVFWAFALITAFTSIKIISIILILVFRLFYTVTAEVLPFFVVVEGSSMASLFIFYNKLFSAMLPFVQQPISSTFIVLFFLASGSALGSAFQMLYTLICRKIDDFGRDYYAQTLKVLGAAGFRSSLLLTLLVAIAIIASLANAAIIPLNLDTTALFIVFIPLALANFIMIALSQNSLRFKISICTSPIFIIIGVFFFIVQTLVPLAPAVEAVAK